MTRCWAPSRDANNGNRGPIQSETTDVVSRRIGRVSLEAASAGGDIHRLKVSHPFDTRPGASVAGGQHRPELTPPASGDSPEGQTRAVVKKRWRRLTLAQVYLAALAFWLATRWLVLVHQGAWPWMNAFVVAAARGIVVGDWNEAVRPQLPAVLGVPLVLAGATEQQTVAGLYVIASLVQFGAFLLLVRALFPHRLTEQSLALLIFLLVPYNHSIHHYRDVPVVLSSSAVFLLSAHFLRSFAPDQRANPAQGVRSALWVFGAMLVGVWSRAEVLTFVAVLVVLALLVWRRAALRLATTYLVAAAVLSGSLLLVFRLEGVDPAQAQLYQAHTFLDSTPDSWLTPECRADPTENCREADGLVYFGPADLHAGVVPLVLGHPLTTLAKTLRSALDNLWIVFGPNLSTFPGSVPFIGLVLAAVPSARARLRQAPAAVWMVVSAVVAETALPPLSWAPPHPQYHLQLVLPVVVLLVPLLLALGRTPPGRLLAVGFLIGNAALSAFRYTRYPGY